MSLTNSLHSALITHSREPVRDFITDSESNFSSSLLRPPLCGAPGLELPRGPRVRPHLRRGQLPQPPRAHCRSERPPALPFAPGGIQAPQRSPPARLRLRVRRGRQHDLRHHHRGRVQHEHHGLQQEHHVSHPTFSTLLCSIHVAL